MTYLSTLADITEMYAEMSAAEGYFEDAMILRLHAETTRLMELVRERRQKKTEPSEESSVRWKSRAVLTGKASVARAASDQCWGVRWAT